MEKSSTFPLVRCWEDVPGYEDRKNDVVFCGLDAQQHVVFFPGDVQVRWTDFVFGSDSDESAEEQLIRTNYLQIIQLCNVKIDAVSNVECILRLYAKLFKKYFSR